MAAITKEVLRAELESFAAGELGRTIASHLSGLVREDLINTLRSAWETSWNAHTAIALAATHDFSKGSETRSALSHPRSVVARAALNDRDFCESDVLNETANSNAGGLSGGNETPSTRAHTQPATDHVPSNDVDRGVHGAADEAANSNADGPPNGSWKLMASQRHVVAVRAAKNDVDSDARVAVDNTNSGQSAGCSETREHPQLGTTEDVNLGVHGAEDEITNSRPRRSVRPSAHSYSSSDCNIRPGTDLKRHHMKTALEEEAFAEIGLTRNNTVESRLGSRADSRLESIVSGALVMSEESFAVAKNPQMQYLVEHPAFDYVTSAVIIANAVTMGLQTEDFARRGDPDAPMPTVYRILSVMFCVFFTLELAMRIGVHRSNFFKMEDSWHFNILDTLLVVFQIFEELWNLSSENSRRFSFTFLRILRLFVAIRVLRVARILRFVRQLRSIVTSIAQSAGHIFWTVVVLCILMYILGVYLTDLVANFAHDNASLKPYFGSVGTSVLTLFQSISGGLDWATPSSLLAQEFSPAVSVGFCFYVSLVLFTLVNNINGVFVESALRNAKRHHDLDTFRLATELFLQTDIDKNGVLTWDEFESQLDSKAMKKYFEVLDLDIAEARTLFNLIDVDESGLLDPSEFVNGCFRLRGSAKGIEFAAFLREFYEVVEMVKDLKYSVTERLAMLETDMSHCRGATESILRRVKDSPSRQGTADGLKRRIGQPTVRFQMDVPLPTDVSSEIQEKPALRSPLNVNLLVGDGGMEPTPRTPRGGIFSGE